MGSKPSVDFEAVRELRIKGMDGSQMAKELGSSQKLRYNLFLTVLYAV